MYIDDIIAQGNEILGYSLSFVYIYLFGLAVSRLQKPVFDYVK